ncbi:Stomatin-like protein [Schistosoma japonicum]|nr:Stomatin-like protein [Schistosoma japonicum]
MRELNTRLSCDSHLINKNIKFGYRHSKDNFKWPLIRHRSEDPNITNKFIQPRYKFSYETDSNVKQIEFTKPFDLLSLNSLGGSRQTFDFSTAFNFSECKSDTQNPGNNYRTIFTYSDPITTTLDFQLNIHDFTDNTYSKTVNSRIHYAFIILSTLLLIVFFPFLCWFYVKHLMKNERIIVFRLGKRIRTKGPGWIVILPICDRYHLISLDDQTIKIKPVSGGTKDEAVVEVTCSITFYLLEPDYAFSTTNKSPLEIATTQTQLCLLSSLTHLEWCHLEQGNAKIDLANETKGTLNSRCGAYGIYVKEVTINDLVLLRPPPTHNPKSNIELVTKHLQQLSCVLLNNHGINPLLQPEKWSEPQQHTDDNLSSNSLRTESLSVPSDIADSASTNLLSSTPLESEIPLTTRTTSADKVQKLHSSKAFDTLSQLRFSHNHPALSKAITRAQGLLNSDIACQALERASLQLVVSIENKFCKDNLPSMSSAVNQGCILLYLDAGTGHVGSGCLPLDKQPNVTLFIHIDDLINVVEGRLDVLNAVESDKAFMTGSLTILSKMRHLLYLPPF